MQLHWEPKVPVRVGLAKAIAYFAKELAESGEIIPTGSDPSKPNKVGRSASQAGSHR